MYEVLVGNVGTVWEDSRERYSHKRLWAARIIFADWVKESKAGNGRASGEPVYLLENGEPIEEYEPGEDR